MVSARVFFVIFCMCLGSALVVGCDDAPADGDGDGDSDGDGDGDADADEEPACPDDWDCCADDECSDGLFCNGVEVCDRGRCEQDPDAYCSPEGVCQISCEDGIECTEDVCNERANLCEHRPQHDLCLDENLCNGDERCDPADEDADERGCTAGMPLICDDRDDCTDDYCEESECRTRLRDQDGDGFGDDGCQWCEDPEDPTTCVRGDDCNDTNDTVFPGAPEICDDGVDNNCDRIRDYADPDCSVPNDDCRDALELTPEVTINASTRRTVGNIDSSCSHERDRDVAFFFATSEVQDVEIQIDARGGRSVTVALSSDCGNAEMDLRCTTGRDFTQINRALPSGTYFVIVSSTNDVDFEITLHTSDPAPRPEGDQCTAAIDASDGGVFSGTTEGFDPDYDASCGEVTDRDATFAVTVEETSAMDLRVTAREHLAVAVQSACGVPATELACFEGSPAEGWVRSLSPGTHYIIVKSAVAQEFDLEVEFMPAAADECDDARRLDGPGSYRGSTLGMEASIDSACGDESAPDSVYAFRIREERDVIVDFVSDADTTLSLSSECGDPDEELRCTTGTDFQLRGRGLRAGTYYLIATGTRAGGSDFDFDIDFIEPRPRPPQDLCEGAVDIGRGGAFSGDTDGCENDYPSRCGEDTDLDMAFTFTLREARSMDISVSSERTRVAVSVQPACGVLDSERGCFVADLSADRHYRNLDAGTYYLIFKTPGVGAFEFDVSFGPPEESVPFPFIALPYDYFAFDEAAADLAFRAVTYGYDGALPMVGAVSECADTTGGTSGGNPGGPYAGEYNATVGAMVYGGLPRENVIQITNQPDAAARMGTYDVLMFMEFESCRPNAALWRATIEDHLDGGGRVVVTFGGTGATFVNELGLFGRGSSAGVRTPFSIVPHPFWDGLVHPGTHSATTGWNWDGPGLVPLGRDASGTNLTVFAYEPDF